MMIDLFLLSADYKNEAEVGEALAEAFQTRLVKREDLFITTKASCNNPAPYFFFSGFSSSLNPTLFY